MEEGFIFFGNLYIWLRNALMIASCFAVLVSCGDFAVSQHPDDSFRYGRGIQSADNFGSYYNNQNVDPRFRRARVTTQSSPLRLKTEPRSDGPAPSSGPSSLARGSELEVFWPLDINNNHVKVRVQGHALWVTYRSSGGQEYVTLLEDIYLPETNVASSGTFTMPGVPAFGPQVTGNPTSAPGQGGGNPFVPEDLNRVSLSANQIRQAHIAIGNVDLQAAEVQACTFDPAVGNNSGSNNCYNEIVISSAFRDFVARYGQQCAVSAAREAFGFSARKILFHSSSAGQVSPTRTVSGTSRLSTHATGQAFDLFAITAYSDSGSRKVIMHRDQTDGSSTTERQNHTFYWSFARCWRQRVHDQAPCASSCGANVGAMTYTDNSAHHNHLHMSLPMCNRGRYNVSCI